MRIDPNEVREYLKTCGPNSKVYIGADSKRFRLKGVWHADYMLVVVVHINGRNGCKIFGEIQRERDYDVKLSKPATRLMNEVYKVAELYARLENTFIDADIYDVEVHLDINPNELCGSSVVIQQAIGYIKGTCNVTPMVKPEAFAASYAADRFKSIRPELAVLTAA